MDIKNTGWRMGKTVTIKDIAEQLELSRNTVAKALNGKYVPEKTRERILAKARELNYKSIGASMPLPGHKRLLLFTGKPLGNFKFFTPIIRGIENYCFENRHELFQYTFNSETMSFSAISDYIKSLDADGIIAVETFDKEFIVKLINLGLPICFIDFTATSTPIIGNYDIIGTNNMRPIYEITRMLHRQYGTTRFSFVGDYMHCLSFEERYFGMLQALAIDGIEHTSREDILRSDNFNYGSTAAMKAEILKLRNMPGCFICGNDFIARSICHALKSIGVNVPNKCFVVGYDNIEESCSCDPQITSFACNREFLGAEGVRVLISRIDNPSIPTRTITVRAKPIYRTSTER